MVRESSLAFPGLAAISTTRVNIRGTPFVRGESCTVTLGGRTNFADFLPYANSRAGSRLWKFGCFSLRWKSVYIVCCTISPLEDCHHAEAFTAYAYVCCPRSGSIDLQKSGEFQQSR